MATGRTWCLALALAAAGACGKSSPAASDAARDVSQPQDTMVDARAIDAPPDAVPDAPPPPPQALLQGTWTYVKASTTHSGDHFGTSVALSSDGATLAVGAPFESTTAATSGAVYVYQLGSGGWAFQTALKASNAGGNDQFGTTVALSADGNTLAVGAPNEGSCAVGIGGSQTDNSCGGAGAVYVFARTGTSWSQQAYVKPSNTPYNGGNGFAFGFGLALSGDGNTLAAGAPGESSPATGIDGQQTFFTAVRSGAAYVFTRAGTTWSQQTYVKASNTDGNDQFGYSVALSSDASVMAIGAPNEQSAATGVGGSQLDNHFYNGAGAVYAFRHASTGWAQSGYLKASDTSAMALFGGAVALSGDGATLAAGAPDALMSQGEVYVFAATTTSWLPQDTLAAQAGANGNLFGYSLSLSSDGNMLAVGDPDENHSGTGITSPGASPLAASGAAYVFGRNGRSWYQLDYIKAINSDMYDVFGQAVSFAGDARTLAVGAANESSSATGVGGTMTDNSVANAGAAYVIR